MRWTLRTKPPCKQAHETHYYARSEALQALSDHVQAILKEGYPFTCFVHGDSRTIRAQLPTGQYYDVLLTHTGSA